METESPAQRLTRRVGAGGDRGGRGDGGDRGAESATSDTETEPQEVLGRWLPEQSGSRTPGDWLTTLRADPGRYGVLALLGVGIVAVLVTVFTVVRSPDRPVASANLPPVQMVSTASRPPGAPAPPDGPVVVSVVGLVHRPGLVTLTAGDRVADAVQGAGGALDGADLVGLNMARRVADGEQIIVGIAAPPGSPSPMGSSVSSATSESAGSGSPGSASPGSAQSAATGMVNLNTATAEELDALPGVGPVTAAAIIAWRDAHGPFAGVEQLGEVDGIGPARLDKLRDLVTA